MPSLLNVFEKALTTVFTILHKYCLLGFSLEEHRQVTYLSDSLAHLEVSALIFAFNHLPDRLVGKILLQVEVLGDAACSVAFN